MAHTIVFHVIKASKRLQNALGIKANGLELSSSEASALLIIGAQKNTCQIDIALKLHLKPASVVSLIDELENLNLVTRKTPKTDRRKYQIQLTNKGRQEVKKIRTHTKQIDNYVRSRLSDKEIETLITALEKLSDDYDLDLKSLKTNQKNLKGKEVKNEIPGAKRQMAS